MANLKVKSVNAYEKENGNKLIVIEFDNKDKCFINEGLVAYACQHSRKIKPKDKKDE